MGSLMSKNISMLFKWIWRLSLPDHALWKQVTTHFYSPTFENGIPKLHGHISPFWKDVLSILDPNSVIGLVLRENIKFKIGDGSSILFWSDVWIGSNALRSIFPKLYQISTFRNGLVNEMGQWVNDQWRWNLVWRRKLLSYEEQQYHHLLSMLEPTIIRQGKDDKLIWPCNSDGSFSVKSCCTLIDNTSSATDRVFEANVWIKGPPRKFRCFSGWQYRTKLVQELFFINGLFCLPHKLHVSFAAQIWKPQSIFLYIVTFLGVFG